MAQITGHDKTRGLQYPVRVFHLSPPSSEMRRFGGGAGKRKILIGYVNPLVCLPVEVFVRREGPFLHCAVDVHFAVCNVRGSVGDFEVYYWY